MIIIKLRNWIIPFKLARLLVMHDSEKLTRVGGGGGGCAPLHPTTTVTFICLTSLIMVVKYGHLRS